MKRLTLALAAVLVAFAIPVHAAVVIKAFPKLTFPKNATYDSTEVAIPTAASGTADVASQDTTGWFELSGIEFREGGAVGLVMLSFQIDHQSIATSDTIGYGLQFTNDETTVSGTTSKFTAPALTSAAVTGNSTVIAGVIADGTAARFVRVILWNKKVTNSNVTRRFSVTPVARIHR